MMVHNVQLFIGGAWSAGAEGRTLPVEDPATGETIGSVAKAEPADLERAAAAAARAFYDWRHESALRRSALLREAATILRGRSEDVARVVTTEVGKPLPEARAEIEASCETMEWFAEEARRAYGRVVPARAAAIRQVVVKEPVGPVAAFIPWN